MRAALLSRLSCTTHSALNRRRAQELVWRWVRLKWPRLVPSLSEMAHGTVERAVPGQELIFTGSGDGPWKWWLAHAGAPGGRTWIVEVQILDGGSADVLSVQASWAGNAEFPLVVAPPRLLSLWVEHLELDDGGVAVIGEPRAVADDQAAQAFCGHVLSEARTLPVIALCHGARSMHYGVDPCALAEALRGVAHVACLSPTVASMVAERWGTAHAPRSGSARIYAPGFVPLAGPDRHPLLMPMRRRVGTPAADAKSFRQLLVQRVCAMSVEQLRSQHAAARAPQAGHPAIPVCRSADERRALGMPPALA